MLDFGFPELILIIAVAVLVVGPDEIPALMRGLGRVMRRLQYMRYAMTQQFEDFMNADESDVSSQVNFETKRLHDDGESEFDEQDADAEYLEEYAALDTHEYKGADVGGGSKADVMEPLTPPKKGGVE